MLKRKKPILFFILLFFISGCAPVLSKKTLETVDRKVKFSDLVKDPEKYKGTKVLLGGTIVGLDTTENKTEIEVLQEPLNYQLKPTNTEESEGRFIAVFDGFKDPAIYSKNRRITVAGVFKGIEKRKLGKMEYGYPLVEPAEYYLWSIPYEREPALGIGVGVGFGYTHIK